VLRVSNDEVLEDVEAVVEGILAFARRMEGR
jgi:very-short-patch-repair endonuclease